MIDDILLIKELPTFILELFNNDLEKVARHTTLLGSSLADGMVFKILINDTYDTKGYETGILYLTKGSCVKRHTHIDDSIKYTLIYGDLKENGESVDACECKCGESHEIETVSADTAIYTQRQNQKVKKIYIDKDERKNLF